MKKHLLIFCLLLFSIGFATKSAAQLATIDKLEIIPDIPINTDEVRVYAEAHFSSGGCDLYKYNVEQHGHEISVIAYHRIGALAYICPSNNTIPIGVLEAGNYSLRYYIVDGESSSTLAQKDIGFYVSSLPKVPVIDQRSSGIYIFPNPFTTDLTIKIDPEYSNSTFDVHIYDMVGREVKNSVDIAGPEIIIPRSGLEKGLYFVNVLSNNKLIAIRKIVAE